jgi:hypothetical protein
VNLGDIRRLDRSNQVRIRSAQRSGTPKSIRAITPKRAMLALARQDSTVAALPTQMPARDEGGTFF